MYTSKQPASTRYPFTRKHRINGRLHGHVLVIATLLINDLHVNIAGVQLEMDLARIFRGIIRHMWRHLNKGVLVYFPCTFSSVYI